MYFFIFFITLFSFLTAELSLPSNTNPFLQKEPELRIQNAVLAKVHGKPLTVMDLVKRMDLQLYRFYPEIADRPLAKFQFYQSHWKQTLEELINTELILLDAEGRQLKLSDGEIREEMESRFGPNTRTHLDRLGIRFEEAWDMIKQELLVQKMSGYFVEYKARQQVTPQQIRSFYQAFIKENPSTEIFTYRVISIRSSKEEQAKNLTERVYPYLNSHKENLEIVKIELDSLKKEYPDASFSISPIYESDKESLSPAYLNALAPLEPSQLSSPIKQSKKGEILYRLFYLVKKEPKKAPSLEEMLPSLRQKALQVQAEKAAKDYFQKLRKQYAHAIREEIPPQFEPFLLQ